ncbi:TPA: phage late control D family protein [Vibrio parahaemolyticus]
MGRIAGSLIKPFAIVKWAGKEISQELSDYVSALTYTDVLDSKKVGTDTVSMTLVNHDGRFYDAWFPEKGDTLECGIGWFDDDGKRNAWMWGKFTIDEIRFSLNPDKVSVGANAKPATRGKIDNETCEVYEQTSFVTLAEDIAKEVGVSILIAPDARDVAYARVQQRDESKMAMMGRLADENSIPMAFKGNQLVVGELNTSTLTLDIRNRDIVVNGSFPVSDRTKSDGIIVQFYDVVNDTAGEYRTGNTDEGAKIKTLTPDGVTSMEEAKSYADNYVATGSGKSKQTATGRLTLVNATVTTADTIALTNAGKLPDKWKPTSVSTSLTSGGWTSTVTIQRRA